MTAPLGFLSTYSLLGVTFTLPKASGAQLTMIGAFSRPDLWICGALT